MRLRLEIAIARLAGRLSRVAGRGGGTTLPGKLLVGMDRGAVRQLSSELPAGAVLVTATNGKTTTSAMAAEILRGRFRLAHNRAGANLLSGVASTLMEARGSELALLEVDEGAFARIAREVAPQVVCLGNLFRDQLDRYGELELIAERWREAVASLPEHAKTVVNADDPLLAALVSAPGGSVRFGLDDPSVARERLTHAADSKYCRDCGTPLAYDAVYVGHLGSYRCPGCGSARPQLDVVARSIVLDGLEGTSFDLATPAGTRRVSLRVPGLYNVYNAVAAAVACACARRSPR